ncbi:MAG: HNH endonuclease, partial [Pseudomonadota bacterium]
TDNTASTVTPIEYFTYDRRGNLIESKNALGARHLYWYDDLDRVTHEVNPTGTVSRNWYDANGNLTDTRVYSSTIALPSSATGTPPSGSGSYRRTTFIYDNLNRMTRSTVHDVQTATFGTSLSITSTTSDISINYLYDAMGNVIRTQDANGKYIHSYYDKLGRKTSQVDQERYRTDWTYDAQGNVTRERKFWNKTSTPYTSSVPSVSYNSTLDRITDFTYDLQGNRKTEKRLNVKAHNGYGGYVNVHSTVSYNYNGLGLVTRKTEATGDYIDYSYDGQGRVKYETRRSYTGHTGSSVTPKLQYFYNGLDNVSRVYQFGGGGLGAKATRYNYDYAGRLISKVDTAGFTNYYYYDKGGRLVREKYSRITATQGTKTEAIGYTYDLSDRIKQESVMRWTGSYWSKGDRTDTIYNAYGEVAQRGTNGKYSEKSDYDKAGRVWRTTMGDGTFKYFLYDKNGNQTVAFTSDGTNIDNKSMAQILAYWSVSSSGANANRIYTNYVNGVTATITKYDAKNQAIEIREPEREIRENVRYDLITKRGYNAFGETSYEIDANNARIDYTYNNMGRLTKVQSPTVSVTGLNGVKTNVRPTEQYYHDYSGRLVANRDANNNLTRQYLLAGTGYNGSQALITQITAADGGLTRTKYDIFGNAREIKDELNRVTTQSFDAMGRVTQINHAGGKRDYFQYDGLGQQIKRWNNFYGSGNAEQTDYDMQGRVVRHRAIGGDVTTHSYYWSSSYSTSGLGTFGGWNQNTTYANGKVLTERTDAFGREIYQNDLGSRTTYYNYNKAGQLIRRYGSGTEDQDYSYLNTGKINEAWGQTGTTASQNWTRLTATYQYDKVGNLKKESLVQTGQYTYEEYEYYGYGGGAGPSTTVVVNTSSTLKNATATYDALGRLKTWNESGNSITPVASRSFEYDANGNIRRSRGVYRTLSATGTASSTNKVDDYWYRYDNMNRVVTAKGVRSGSTIVRGSNGTDIYYNKAGERVYILQSFQDTAWISDGYEWDDYGYEEVFIPVNFTNTRRENYTYDSAGRLTHIRTSEGSYNETTGGVNAPSSTGTLRGRFYYDTLGRQTRQLDYLSNGSTVAYDQTRSYNQKSQVTSETTITRRGGSTYRTTSTYSYGSGSSYALGAATYISTRVFKKNSSTQTDYYSSTTNNYQWWTGAVQSSTVYRPNTSQSTTNTTSYYYSAGGTLQRAYVADGRARNVDFTVDQNGQVIRRDERDNRYSYGDPHEVWYRFGGKEMGYIGNNGTLNVSHAQSISTRTASQGTGAFRNGSNYGSSYADFDQAYGAINSFSQGSTGGLYSVNRGDTLQSVAANVYGDSSLWYKIAEANGMTGQSQLSVGQKLVLPTGVVKSSHNANTFKAYDPSETIGDLNPTTPEPPKASKKKCGVLGAILLVVVAVAVTIVTAGAAAAVLAPTSMTLGAGISAAVTGTLAAKAGVAAAIAGGVIGGAVGSVASQAVGVATGIQDKFSWKAVALAGISGGVGAGVGTVIKGSTAVKAALRGAVTSATTQGIGVATGLQEKFSWAAVAASGVSSGVSVAAGAAFGANSFVADQSVGNIAANVLATSASSISYAATKSLIDGSNFGDNVLSSVPDIVGSTLANFFAGAMTNNRIERIVNTIHRKANIPGKPEDTQISREVVAEMLARGASKEDIIWMLNETAVGDALRDFNVTRGEGITADESGARADYILEEYGARLKAASSGGGPAGAGAKTTAETTDQTEQVMDGGKLEEIIVYGKRGKGPSGETIVSKTISGGVKLVDGLVTLQEKRPLLANILYNSAGFVAGGPTKSLASKAAGVIFDGAKDTATDWIAGKAEGYITGLAEDYGWELDFSIMDKKIHVGAEQIGLGGGQLTGIVADFIFGNGLDSVVKKGHKARTGIIEHAPRVRKVNGRLPINSRKYAGRTVPLSDMPKHLRGKYPHSVTFTGDGFPDFSRYSKKNVRIELGKSRSTDFRRADKAAGFNASNPRPEGFTWHHHQDSGRMQLVPTDLHDWLKHTGGVATNK